MEKKVSRIYPVSEPSTIYFLQVTWEEDLGTGFIITLSDGQSAWTGTVSEAEISKEADDMEMEREKYVEELRKALVLGAGPANMYNFDVSKDEENVESCDFSYEKNLKDVSVNLGSLKLQKVSNCIADLHVEKCINKIFRISYCVCSVPMPRTTSVGIADGNYLSVVLGIAWLPSKLLLKEREDYDGSTDEESENFAQPSTLASAPSRKDSLLSSPDVTDMAPIRKRRQRIQKPAGVEPKVAAYETQLPAKEKSKAAKNQAQGLITFDDSSESNLQEAIERKAFTWSSKQNKPKI
uniref:X-ray repair cross complementing 4 n=1 Tax=Gopherus evgoodei TaxID=1825980 RepID=A0A8C4WEX3_9SAUR